MVKITSLVMLYLASNGNKLYFSLKKKVKIILIFTIYSLKGEGITCMHLCNIYSESLGGVEREFPNIFFVNHYVLFSSCLKCSFVMEINEGVDSHLGNDIKCL